MNWKFKILDIRKEAKSIGTLRVYYSILVDEGSGFEPFRKGEIIIQLRNLSGSARSKQAVVKTKVKQEIRKLIDDVETEDDLKPIIGYQEVL